MVQSVSLNKGKCKQNRNVDIGTPLYFPLALYYLEYFSINIASEAWYVADTIFFEN